MIHQPRDILTVSVFQQAAAALRSNLDGAVSIPRVLNSTVAVARERESTLWC